MGAGVWNWGWAENLDPIVSQWTPLDSRQPGLTPQLAQVYLLHKISLPPPVPAHPVNSTGSLVCSAGEQKVDNGRPAVEALTARAPSEVGLVD